MPSKRQAVPYELVTVKDELGEEVVVLDHRGVYLLVEFDVQKVGIRDREDLDEQPALLISGIDGARVYKALRELMIRRDAASIEQLNDLAIKSALLGVLDAISGIAEDSDRTDRATALAKIVDIVETLPLVHKVSVPGQ